MEDVLEVFVGRFDVGKVVAIGFLWTGEDDIFVGVDRIVSSAVAWLRFFVDESVG